ncbi:MAG: c-type cytochrome biogenesis protein CcmI [Paracoccaceae bacterium]|nr:c-type cytochrome biogenesis protein CcmI [Paracoccaceae bacterium]MDG2259471.1 c-type cytochrome biogenesis protein CcmI [Paracoccaceae bacterium]
MIWGLISAMAILSSAILLGQLARKSNASVSPQNAVLSVLNDQLLEVQRDTARGLISEKEAHAADQEIKRRILALGRQNVTISSGNFGNIAIVIAAVFVPLLAVTYYNFAGEPDIASVAFADRKEELAEQRRSEDLTGRLADQLQNDPDGGTLEGWMLLGQTYIRMGRSADAAISFENASEKDGADSVVFSMLAEALIFAEQGVVTSQAERAIDTAVLLNPTNPAASYYKALALSQNGKDIEAHNTLLARLNSATDFAPWMETFVTRANVIAESIDREAISLVDFAPIMNASTPGPTAEDVQAAGEMSEEDRNDFIKSMVARLADRLQDEPDDLDGWMRLGNAYRVLNESENAISAYSKAEALLLNMPSTDPQRAEVDNALENLKGSK